MPATLTEECLRVQARALREKKAAAAQSRRLDEERLDRFRSAVEARGDAVRPLLWALDPHNAPPSAEELEAHYRRVTPPLAAALAALRETEPWSRLDQLDETATIANYRQQGEDPQESQIAWNYARQVIEADPDDQQGLTQLLRGAVEEPSLRGAWHWMAILLNGLAGNQVLYWAGKDSAEPPAAVPGEVSSVARKTQRRRGRTPDTDPKADKRIWEAWRSRAYKDYQALAQELKKSKREVAQALDRHRHRLKKRRPSAPEQLRTATRVKHL